MFRSLDFEPECFGFHFFQWVLQILFFVLVDCAPKILRSRVIFWKTINISSHLWWGLGDNLDKSYALKEGCENLSLLVITSLWVWLLPLPPPRRICILQADHFFTVLCLYISMWLWPQWGKYRTKCPWIIFSRRNYMRRLAK